MTQGIHIKSLEALRDFQTSLMLYRHETEDALDKAEMEAEQALADVGDALSTTLQQIEDSREELAQARDDLNTCQGGYGDEEDDEPDCSAEEQAVADAEEGLRKAEERADTLQHARRRLEEAVGAYGSQARYLKEFLELDLLRADGTLAAKIEAIEAYLGVAAPATPSLPASVSTGSSLRAASEPRQEPAGSRLRTGFGSARMSPGDTSQPNPSPMVATASKKLTGQVVYGRSDLGQAVIKYRREQQVPLKRNVAVFEYRGADGSIKTIARASERGKGHAERLIADELEKLGVHPYQVTRIVLPQSNLENRSVRVSLT